MNKFPNFAEGDSGIVMSPAIRTWHEICEEQAKDKDGENVSIEPTDFFAEVAGRAMAIARNKKNSAASRVAALEVARKAVMDQMMIATRFSDT